MPAPCAANGERMLTLHLWRNNDVAAFFQRGSFVNALLVLFILPVCLQLGGSEVTVALNLSER